MTLNNHLIVKLLELFLRVLVFIRQLELRFNDLFFRDDSVSAYHSLILRLTILKSRIYLIFNHISPAFAVHIHDDDSYYKQQSR